MNCPPPSRGSAALENARHALVANLEALFGRISAAMALSDIP